MIIQCTPGHWLKYNKTYIWCLNRKRHLIKLFLKGLALSSFGKRGPFFIWEMKKQEAGSKKARKVKVQSSKQEVQSRKQAESSKLKARRRRKEEESKLKVRSSKQGPTDSIRVLRWRAFAQPELFMVKNLCRHQAWDRNGLVDYFNGFVTQ